MGLAGRQAVGRAVIKVQHSMPGLVVEQEGRPGNGLTDWTGYRRRGLLTEWWRSGFRGASQRYLVLCLSQAILVCPPSFYLWNEVYSVQWGVSDV